MNHPNRSFAGALAVFAVILILCGWVKSCVLTGVRSARESHDFFRGLHECSSGNVHSGFVDR